MTLISNNFNYLPPSHRPDGSRPRHDDFRVWPFTLIPRWWLARPLGGLPFMIFGKCQWAALGPLILSWERYIPKPIGNYAGDYQFTIIPTLFFGRLTLPLPYFAITLKLFGGLWHFRIGLGRFSDDVTDQGVFWYCELFPIAIKKLEEK